MVENINCNETIEDYVGLIDDVVDSIDKQVHALQSVISMVRNQITEGRIDRVLGNS
jgi:hypothetical protein